MKTVLSRLALAAALLASVPAVAQSDWDAVVAAAKKEGTVNVYNAAIGAKFYYDTAAAFTKAYGIKVETLDVRVTELTQRLRTEETTHQVKADVSQNGEGQTLLMARDGMIAKLPADIPNLANLRPELKVEEFQTPCYLQATGFLVNTDMVKPADMPKSWHDLLDPKWKGKILQDDPKAPGAGQSLFANGEMKFEPGFNQRWAAQNPTFDRDLSNAAQRVARGEFPIEGTQIIPFSLTLNGLPVKLVIPTEGVPYTDITCNVMKDAPHPNAAKLFINYMLSKETQIRYGNGGEIPVVKDVADATDPAVRDIMHAKLLTFIQADDVAKYLAMAKDVFGAAK